MNTSVRAFLRVLVALAVTAIAAWRFAVLDAASHSASDTLRPWLAETAVLVIAAILIVRAVERLGGWADRRP